MSNKTRYNPERKDFKGISYKKGYVRIRDLKDSCLETVKVMVVS